jgi:hypothetical protein
MEWGHKVAVMVRLIGAAVNELERPWGYWSAETAILVKATAPEATRAVPSGPLDKAICGCNTVITTKNEWRKP